ncbi:MAG: PhoU domain-containing protein, partial [Acidobacteriota bacterium]
MLKELISLFRSDNPLAAIAEKFSQMLSLAWENTQMAGQIYFGKQASPEERSGIYKKDIEINKLERAIRKRVVAHLSFPENIPDVPYGLLMMSLVKDVERLGDYAKNLVEVMDQHGGRLPGGELLGELKEIRADVERGFKGATDLAGSSDTERALDLIRAGRDIAQRCDLLITKIARSDTDAATTTAALLATRYYKRISGHVLNILSSIVMPLHKLDYYDE